MSNAWRRDFTKGSRGFRRFPLSFILMLPFLPPSGFLPPLDSTPARIAGRHPSRRRDQKPFRLTTPNPKDLANYVAS